MSWVYLILAGIFEVGFTTTMRYLDGFKNLWAMAIFLICVALSLVFLEMATITIPLGTAYVIWTGIGAVGTVLIGIIWFSEPTTTTRLLMMTGIVSCVIGLKLTSGH